MVRPKYVSTKCAFTSGSNRDSSMGVTVMDWTDQVHFPCWFKRLGAGQNDRSFSVALRCESFCNRWFRGASDCDGVKHHCLRSIRVLKRVSYSSWRRNHGPVSLRPFSIDLRDGDDGQHSDGPAANHADKPSQRPYDWDFEPVGKRKDDARADICFGR
jgi:hypothetical protein